jgi:hypothetical protein
MRLIGKQRVSPSSPSLEGACAKRTVKPGVVSNSRQVPYLLNNPKYLAAIIAAVETQVIDFKAAFCWQDATKCERFEILKDIAAMANVGGGLIIIGRDEPNHTAGSLDTAEATSFDPTEVNKVVHRYLASSIECGVELEIVNRDTLAVIDVPEFEPTPLVFQEIGNCGVDGCKKTPHFKQGDLFIRTKAQQSQRISTPPRGRRCRRRGTTRSRLLRTDKLTYHRMVGHASGGHTRRSFWVDVLNRIVNVRNSGVKPPTQTSA